MKKVLLTTALMLPLVSVNAVADDTKIMALENSNVIEMTDAELGAVQGGVFDICVACILTNTAVVTQVNISLFSLGALQANNSLVAQGNN